MTQLALCMATAFASSTAYSRGGEVLALRQSPAHPASILPVTSCADDGSPGTLRVVVASAASGDTIDLTNLACGTTTLLACQVQSTVDDLTILGPGRDALTIDGNDNGRVFAHYGAGTLTLQGLTVANGRADTDHPQGNPPFTPASVTAAYGGCVFATHHDYYNNTDLTHGSVAIIDSVVTSCTAHATSNNPVHGGGIHARGGTTIIDSVVSECAAKFDGTGILGGGGGAIFTRQGVTTITDSIITGNRAETTTLLQIRGGGISTYREGTTISGSVIANNFAGCDTAVTNCNNAFGGGIDTAGPLHMDSTTVTGNIVEANGSFSHGGGIFFSKFIDDGEV
jgi:hypothetical protein